MLRKLAEKDEAKEEKDNDNNNKTKEVEVDKKRELSKIENDELNDGVEKWTI